MSYAVQAPPVAAGPRRPASVSAAAMLLAVMAVVGLGYAVATLAVAPGAVDEYRSGGAVGEEIDGTVFLVWAGAGVAVAAAVLLFALYAVLAVGLRRGSNAARITTWVVCAIGILAGCGSGLTVYGQDGLIGDGGGAAYPSGWVGLNIAMTVAQIAGYVTVAGLLVASPGHFFHSDDSPAPAVPAGPYGGYGALPGMPGLYNQPPAPTPPPAQPPTAPYSAPYGGNPYAAPRAPEPGPDDEYWSRPST